MKKILFIANSLEIGGMERALVNLLNALSDNYEITLILEKKIGLLRPELDKRIEIQEYKVCDCGFPIFRKIRNFTKRVLWSIKNKNKYDFSCSYATYSLIGSKLAIIGSKNSSLYVHSDYYGVYHGNVNKIKKFFKSLSYKKFKNLIFVSNESLSRVKDILKISNGKVINNLTDYKLIKRLSFNNSSVNFPKDKINILFVGRLDNTSKNFDLLLNSFKLVAKDKYNLFILGNGYYKDNITNLIKKLHLENNVKLLNEVKNPYTYISKCDCLILTSRYEGYPMIYSEALVLNKKFITTIKSSDLFIDVSKYFCIVSPSEKSIAEEITKIDKTPVNYKVDFESINRYNLNEIEKIIEMEV